MLLVGLVLALVMIESKVEQLGLFKALGEQNSLEGFHIAQGDLFWVSLMLVIPTVACCVVLGFREGERLANLAQLRALRHEVRQEIRLQGAYSATCALHQQVQYLRLQDASVEAEIEAHRARIRAEFTLEEKERLEDMEMDAAMASWEAEDSMLDSSRDPESSQPRKLRDGLLGWLTSKLSLRLARCVRRPQAAVPTPRVRT